MGYAIRGESKRTKKTKLLFVTTGVALRRLALEKDRMLTGVSHIIVDEVCLSFILVRLFPHWQDRFMRGPWMAISYYWNYANF